MPKNFPRLGGGLPGGGRSSCDYPWFMYLPGCAGFSGDPCGWYDPSSQRRDSTALNGPSASAITANFAVRAPGMHQGIPGVWDMLPGITGSDGNDI